MRCSGPPTPRLFPPRTRGLVLALALLGAAAGACEETGPGPGADGALDAAPLADARVDGGLRDAGYDGGRATPRDAGPLPCADPAWFSPHVGRIQAMTISANGYPGDGLDVDDNPSTCAPAGRCSGGIDNQGGAINITGCGAQDMTPAGLNNLLYYVLYESDPPEVWLMELRDLQRAGLDSLGPFTVVFQHGVWMPSAECPEVTDVRQGLARCQYLADAELFEWGTCTPLSTLDNAELQGGVLTAGGDGHTLRIVYRALGLTAGIALHRARLRATVVEEDGRLRISQATLGGVMCPRDLMDMGAELLHVDPELCGMAEKMPAPDLEAGCDPDLDPDAISVGFELTISPASISGLLQH